MADFWDPVHFDHDVAQLCLNGHVINPRSIEYPEFNQEFCEKCGETTTTDCPSCGSKIRGKTMGSLIAERFYAPNYCLKCGKPYPWTEHRLRTAKELADGFDELNEDDRKKLKESLDDLVKDSPATEVAGRRFKKIVAKLGKESAGAIKSVIIDVLSETAKKILLS